MKSRAVCPAAHLYAVLNQLQNLVFHPVLKVATHHVLVPHLHIFVHHLQNHLNLHYHQVVHPYAAVLQHYVIVVVLLPLLPLVYHTNHHLLYPLVHHVLRQSPHLILL